MLNTVKRIFTLILAGMMLVPLCACTASPAGKTPSADDKSSGELSGLPESDKVQDTTDAATEAPATETVPETTEKTEADTTAAPETTASETTAPAVIRIACVGDSITYGTGASNRNTTSYPAVLQSLLNSKQSATKYVVMNYGRARAYAINNSETDYKYASAQSVAYTATQEYKNSLISKPDIVLIMLGANDAHVALQNKDVSNKYTAALEKLVATYRGLDTAPEVYLLICTDRFDATARRHSLIKVIIPAIKATAEKLECPTIDLFSVTTEQAEEYLKDSSKVRSQTAYFSDGVHPGDAGYADMAEAVCNALLK